MTITTPKTVDSSHLYFLIWRDCLERMDTLLLEIRHLQISIIHYLRTPDLYAPLRYEERYIWLQRHEPIFRYSLADAKYLAEFFVPEYPAPTQAQEKYAPSETNREDIFEPEERDARNQLNTRVHGAAHRAWYAGGWGRDQRRQYHTLCVLQRTKRQVLLDKMSLFRVGVETGVATATLDRNTGKRPHLLVVFRAALARRLELYLKAIGDSQQQFSKALDSGLQDHPRPLVERRRELGVYMDLLSDRTRDLLRDINTLLDYLNLPSYSKTSPILHGWRHSINSQSFDLRDEAGSTGNTSTYIGYIRSLYWMPDRPDLQPLIAHEVAHISFRDRFDNLSFFHVTTATDPMTTLFVAIYQRIVVFWKDTFPDYEETHPLRDTAFLGPHNLIRELACDFLAISVKGLSYVFALAMELTGAGLEVLLEDDRGDWSLDLIYAIHGGTHIETLASLSWYTRLELAAAWIESIHHHSGVSKLDRVLLNGIRDILSDSIEFLDHTVINRGVVQGWKNLTKDLATLVSSSTAAGLIRQWRFKRHLDDTDDRTGLDGPREFPRSTKRLDPTLRDFLYLTQLAMKAAPGKPLANCDRTIGSLGSAFEAYYGTNYTLSTPSTKPKHNKIAFSPLYRHLYDIPWQCALMRSLDIFGGPASQNRDQLLKEIHFDFAMGRELFAVATEFFVWECESAYSRLTSVIFQVERFIADHDSEDPRANDPIITTSLGLWLAGKSTHPKGTHKTLLQSVQETKKRAALRVLTRIADQREGPLWGATDINSLFKTIKTSTPLYRRAERLAGNALAELHALLGNLISRNPTGDREVELFSLWSYLDIRHRRRETSRSDPTNPYFQILTGFGMPPDHGLPADPIAFQVIGRVVAAGSHPFENVLNQDVRKGLSPLTYVHRAKYGKAASSVVDTKVSMRSVIGRFDSVFFGKTRPLCKCPLPYYGQGHAVEEGMAHSEPFFPFFTRREYGLWCEIVPGQQDGAALDTQEVAGIIAVTLQRRAYRLDFISRVRFATFRQLPETMATPAGSLEHAVQTYLQNSDNALLTDGWGDVLIVIRGKGCRISDLFALQRALYNDFMVDRTELILTPSCVDYALSQEGRDQQYDVRIQVRLREDRELARSNDEFVSAIRDKWQADGAQTTHVKSLVPWWLPGRMDYLISLEYDWSCYTQGQEDGLFDRIWNTLNTPEVDRIESVVIRRAPESAAPPHHSLGSE